ncbi:MAG: DNA (cytosine-5-)-methyltransferase [Flavobacterium sp. BFFFF1]|uniref:DNA cytosine methyltransferase n=1 Tax=Flavobacterium sp. BFFFF1 TaxID=2015557 RepID=UPI000BDDC515|nr:DNA cytosine methyltransferase [Flavobacterium sp. BFFFF1]OYU81414.1 MAG: DNA (cytosine-5-)-methyltransferase [Flavobacterium sp. BFFFF1]
MSNVLHSDFITETLLKTKLVEPESNGRACYTHYLQSSQQHRGTFKKGALKFVKKTLQNQNYTQTEITNVVAEEALQYSLFDRTSEVPFRKPLNPDFEFIDLFAGIGGFRIAGQKNNGECIFSSEWDEAAKTTYYNNFGEFPFGDITKEETKRFIPFGFDVLCGGFPCQPFSQAGLKRGFEDTRGTLFFDVADILNRNIENDTPVKVVFLENVKGLKNHDKGNTLKTIIATLKGLGYETKYEILNSKNFGVPQNRERIFIVAFLIAENKDFKFPLGIDKENNIIYNREDLNNVAETYVRDILEDNPDEKYTISDKLYAGHIRRKKEHLEKGNGFGFSLFHPDSTNTNTISARYYKDGSEILISQAGKNPRKLTPREAANLQGYGENFIIHQSNVQAYKQFGNSVSVPVIEAIFREIKRQLL